MRIAALVLLAGCAEMPLESMGSADAEPVMARRSADGAHGWTLVRTLPLAGAESAVVGLDQRIYVALGDDLLRYTPSGFTEEVATGNRIATLAVDTAGEVYWSEDFDGQIHQHQPPSSGSSLWVAGFHSGDDDVVGMDFAPLDYVGTLLSPGEGLVTDRGFNGADQVWAFSSALGHADDTSNERLVYPDTGVFTNAVDLTVTDSEIWVVDTNAGLFRLDDVSGTATAVSFATTPALVSPIGVDWDRLTGDLYVTQADTDTVVRVDTTTGVVSPMITLPSTYSSARWANVDVSEDGLRLVVTSDVGVHEFARCDVSAHPSATDCDSDGVIDTCQVALGQADCDGDYALDACAAADGDDCDVNGIPDACPTCPELDVVFVMDTSSSLDDEGAAICAAIDRVIADFSVQGIEINPSLLGMTNTPSQYPCLTSTVLDEYGTVLPGDVPDGLTTFADCPGGNEVGTEDWGRAVGVVAGNHWAPGGAGNPNNRRILMPIFDEGPWCGDPVTAIDTTSVDYAIDVALANNVAVFPITTDGSSGSVLAEAQRLAQGTGGTSSSSNGAVVATVINSLITACEVASDCDGDGTLDVCEPADDVQLDCDCDGFFDGCTTTGAPLCEDADGDGFGDFCDTCTDANGDDIDDFDGHSCVGLPDNCPQNVRKLEPGDCGCDYFDVDPPGGSGRACQHYTATLGDGGELYDGVYVQAFASVGEDATVLTNGFIAPRATVEANAVIGASSVVGRMSRVGASTQVGADTTLGRLVDVGASATVGGGVSIGYASRIADGSTLHDGTVVGVLARLDESAVTVGELGGLGAVVARAVRVDGAAVVGPGVVLGPDSVVGARAHVGASTRVRKDTELGADCVIGSGVRIGRGSDVGMDGVVGDGAKLGTGSQILPNACVPANGVVARSEVVSTCE